LASGPRAALALAVAQLLAKNRLSFVSFDACPDSYFGSDAKKRKDHMGYRK